MNKQTEQALIQKVSTLDTIVRVLLDELIDTDVVDFDAIMARLDDIKEEEQKRQEMNDLIKSMYVGKGGDA